MVRVTARLVLCASSQHPPAALDPHWPGWDTAPAPSASSLWMAGWRERRPLGWGGVLGLPKPGPSPPQQGSTRMAGVACRGDAGGAESFSPLPKASRTRRWGMPAPLPRTRGGIPSSRTG